MRDLDLFQLGDAAGRDPFGDEDIPLLVEAGVMRVNEFSIDPLLRFGAHFVTTGGDLLAPFVVIGEMDDFVILVEKGESGREVGDEHEVLVDVDIGGKDERLGEGLEMLAIEVEPLEAAVGAVGHAEGRGLGITTVDPETMGEIEFAVTLSGLADGGEVATGGVITVNAMGAVAVGEIDASVGRMEGGVGWHESVASPIALGGGVLTFGIAAGGHRCALIPNDVSLEGQFGEGLHVLIGGDVEELLRALGADFDAVAAALELAAEGADEFADGIKNEDAGVILDVGIPFVHHVEVLPGIDGNVMSGLPGEFVGELGEVVVDFVLMFTFTDDYRSAGFLGGNNVWEREGGSGEERGFSKEFASGSRVHCVRMPDWRQ